MFYCITDTIYNAIIGRISSRINQINQKYNRSIQDATINLFTVSAIEFWEFCSSILCEDPDYILFNANDSSQLPDTSEDFLDRCHFMRYSIKNLSTDTLVGERLKKARLSAHLSGPDVAKRWNELSEATGLSSITRATISNHERAAISGIKLIDMLRYCYIYNLPSLSTIMWGKSFSMLLLEQQQKIDKEMSNDEITNHENGEIGCPYLELMRYCSNQALMASKALQPEQNCDFIRKLLVIEAEGHCELCDKPAPFNDPEGFPYLKLYTVSPKTVICQGSGMRLNNSVVLCPDCYEMVTIVNSKADMATVKEKADKHSFADVIVHAKRWELLDDIVKNAIE